MKYKTNLIHIVFVILHIELPDCLIPSLSRKVGQHKCD